MSRRVSSCQSQRVRSFHRNEDRIAPSNHSFCPGREASTESEPEKTPTQHCAYCDLSPFPYVTLPVAPYLGFPKCHMIAALNSTTEYRRPVCAGMTLRTSPRLPAA